MEAESFLLTTAQAGLAVAGFSALISAFRRNELQLTLFESINRAMILEMGLASTFFALIPFPIEKVLLDILEIDKGVWRVSSAGLAVFLILWSIYAAVRIASVQKLFPNENIPSPIGFSLLMLTAIGFLILNVFFFGSVSIYEIALIWMLIIAGVQFLNFVHTAVYS